MTTVLICDDHRGDRDTLRRYVSAMPGVDRVALAGSEAEALARYVAERPTLVLMDVRMAGAAGPEAARNLVAAHPEANVVMLANHADQEPLSRAMAGGARGFLVKDVTREELCAAVAHALVDADQQRRVGVETLRRRPVAAARSTRALATVVADDRAAGSRGSGSESTNGNGGRGQEGRVERASREPEEVPRLTERELQVLDGMSRGKTNNEIGRELFLSEDTIKTHARRLFRKLGVNDRAQAVALGFRLGLVH